MRFDKTGSTFIKIEGVSNYISDILPTKLDTIIILVGMNNLSCDSVSTIIDKFEGLIQIIKNKFPSANLFVSHIIQCEKHHGF